MTKQGDTSSSFSWPSVWAFAQLERRLSMRLVRYWIFLVVAVLMWLGLFTYYTFLHTMGAGISASVAYLSPRYLVAAMGFFYLSIFLFAILFLAMDVRAREQREAMLEVLDSRPFSNFELILGRFFGIVMSALLPLVLVALCVQAIAWIVQSTGAPLGDTIEPWSLASMILLICLPAMCFTCALVFAINLLVPRTAIAVVVSIVILSLLYAASLRTLPFALASAIDLFGFYHLNYPSDWLPSLLASPYAWLQRAGVLVMAVSLLFLAARIYPRNDGRTKKINVVGASVSGGLASLAFVLVFLAEHNRENHWQQWRLAHQAALAQARPDIHNLSGRLHIAPGEKLTADLSIKFKGPGASSPNQALFSLNPGFNILKLEDDRGRALDYEFAQGLLRIKIPSAADEMSSHTIRLHYEGKPNIHFAYLDSPLRPQELSTSQADANLLGVRNAFFDKRYVALMPGIHFLPKAGAAIANTGLGEQAQDFFSSDLEVLVPDDWLVAGPALRQKESKGHFRFVPEVALHEIALFAAPFEVLSSNIGGIEFELLLHPDHQRAVETLSEHWGFLEAQIEERLALLNDSGLRYPHKVFSMVEVPNDLRAYGGTWRMASTMAPPTMLLVKETGFPTTHFDFDFRRLIGNKANNAEDPEAASRALYRKLQRHFRNDFTGGNLFAAFAKSIFLHQTHAKGDEALALNYLLDQLSVLVVNDKRAYFSAWKITDLDTAMEKIFSRPRRPGLFLSDHVIDSVSAGDEVWEKVLSVAPDQLDPWQQPEQSVDYLSLKSGTLALLLYERLGPRGSGQLLQAMLNAHAGENFSVEDLISQLSKIESQIAVDSAKAQYVGDLAQKAEPEQNTDTGAENQTGTENGISTESYTQARDLIASWFKRTGLPEFNVLASEVYRLPDNQNGDIQIQVKVKIQNDKPIPGYLRLAWAVEEGKRLSFSELIRVPSEGAVTFGTVLTQAPAELLVYPYLSINREAFLVGKFSDESLKRKDLDGFEGVEVHTQEPNANNKAKQVTKIK